MSRFEYLELSVALYPSHLGGRSAPVSPRDGNYMPVLEVGGAATGVEVRLIEGPPSLRPGEEAVVVVQLEKPMARPIAAGSEVKIIEGKRTVGIGRVLRSW